MSCSVVWCSLPEFNSTNRILAKCYIILGFSLLYRDDWEANLNNEDNLKSKDNLKNEDNLQNKDNLKNEDDL